MVSTAHTFFNISARLCAASIVECCHCWINKVLFKMMQLCHEHILADSDKTERILLRIIVYFYHFLSLTLFRQV